MTNKGWVILAFVLVQALSLNTPSFAQKSKKWGQLSIGVWGACAFTDYGMSSTAKEGTYRYDVTKYNNDISSFWFGPIVSGKIGYVTPIRLGILFEIAYSNYNYRRTYYPMNDAMIYYQAIRGYEYFSFKSISYMFSIIYILKINERNLIGIELGGGIRKLEFINYNDQRVDINGNSTNLKSPPNYRLHFTGALKQIDINPKIKYNYIINKYLNLECGYFLFYPIKKDEPFQGLQDFFYSHGIFLGFNLTLGTL